MRAMETIERGSSTAQARRAFCRVRMGGEDSAPHAVYARAWLDADRTFEEPAQNARRGWAVVTRAQLHPSSA